MEAGSSWFDCLRRVRMADAPSHAHATPHPQPHTPATGPHIRVTPFLIAILLALLGVVLLMSDEPYPLRVPTIFRLNTLAVGSDLSGTEVEAPEAKLHKHSGTYVVQGGPGDNLNGEGDASSGEKDGSADGIKPSDSSRRARSRRMWRSLLALTSDPLSVQAGVVAE